MVDGVLARSADESGVMSLGCPGDLSFELKNIRYQGCGGSLASDSAGIGGLGSGLIDFAEAGNGGSMAAQLS